MCVKVYSVPCGYEDVTILENLGTNLWRIMQSLTSSCVGWQITGLRATRGPPQRFQWPAEAVSKNVSKLKSLKSVLSYICLIELLALDKLHLHHNHLFIWFSIWPMLRCLSSGNYFVLEEYSHITSLPWWFRMCNFLPIWRNTFYNVHWLNSKLFRFIMCIG